MGRRAKSAVLMPRFFAPRNLWYCRSKLLWGDSNPRYLPGKKDSKEWLETLRQWQAEYLVKSGGPGSAAAGIAKLNEVNAAAITVAEVVFAYLPFASVKYSASEFAGIQAACRAIAIFGSTRAKDFGPLALRRVRESLVAKKLSRSYVNQLINRICRMFGWAVTMEMVKPEVHAMLGLLPGLREGEAGVRETAAIEPVEWAIVEATLPLLLPPVQGMVKLQAFTGMRPGEVCDMRVGDVRRCSGNETNVWEYRLSNHKTRWQISDAKAGGIVGRGGAGGKTKITFLGPFCQSVLAPFLDGRRDDEYVFSPRQAVEFQVWSRTREDRREKRAAAKKEVKIPAHIGDHYTARTYRQAIERAIERANQSIDDETKKLPHWHPNQLRHARATELRDEFGIEGSQASLGHATLTAHQIYALKSVRLAREIALKAG